MRHLRLLLSLYFTLPMMLALERDEGSSTHNIKPFNSELSSNKITFRDKTPIKIRNESKAKKKANNAVDLESFTSSATEHIKKQASPAKSTKHTAQDASLTWFNVFSSKYSDYPSTATNHFSANSSNASRFAGLENKSTRKSDETLNNDTSLKGDVFNTTMKNFTNVKTSKDYQNNVSVKTLNKTKTSEAKVENVIKSDRMRRISKTAIKSKVPLLKSSNVSRAEERRIEKKEESAKRNNIFLKNINLFEKFLSNFFETITNTPKKQFSVENSLLEFNKPTYVADVISQEKKFVEEKNNFNLENRNSSENIFINPGESKIAVENLYPKNSLEQKKVIPRQDNAKEKSKNVTNDAASRNKDTKYDSNNLKSHFLFEDKKVNSKIFNKNDSKNKNNFWNVKDFSKGYTRKMYAWDKNNVHEITDEKLKIVITKNLKNNNSYDENQLNKTFGKNESYVIGGEIKNSNKNVTEKSFERTNKQDFQIDKNKTGQTIDEENSRLKEQNKTNNREQIKLNEKDESFESKQEEIIDLANNNESNKKSEIKNVQSTAKNLKKDDGDDMYQENPIGLSPWNNDYDHYKVSTFNVEENKEHNYYETQILDGRLGDFWVPASSFIIIADEDYSDDLDYPFVQQQYAFSDSSLSLSESSSSDSMSTLSLTPLLKPPLKLTSSTSGLPPSFLSSEPQMSSKHNSAQKSPLVTPSLTSNIQPSTKFFRYISPVFFNTTYISDTLIDDINSEDITEVTKKTHSFSNITTKAIFHSFLSTTNKQENISLGKEAISTDTLTRFDNSSVSSKDSSEEPSVKTISQASNTIPSELSKKSPLKRFKKSYSTLKNSTSILNSTNSNATSVAPSPTPTSFNWSSRQRNALTVPLSFPFLFYGHEISQVTVTTEGFLYMSDFLHPWLTTSQYLAPLMAPFNTQLSTLSDVLYFDNGTSFVVWWKDLHLETTDLGPFSFQAILHQNGQVIFLYEKLPVPLVGLAQSLEYPVKIGLSDAYYVDSDKSKSKIVRTIHEYHRVEVDVREVEEGTSIIINPLPTCRTMKTCLDCLVASKRLHSKCQWCPGLNECSDSLERQRQHWLEFGCTTQRVSSLINCEDLSYIGSHWSAKDLSVNLPSNFSSTLTVSILGSGVIGMVCAILGVSICMYIGGWVAYACLHPSSKAGRWIIENRPLNWKKHSGTRLMKKKMEKSCEFIVSMHNEAEL